MAAERRSSTAAAIVDGAADNDARRRRSHNHMESRRELRDNENVDRHAPPHASDRRLIDLSTLRSSHRRHDRQVSGGRCGAQNVSDRVAPSALIARALSSRRLYNAANAQITYISNDADDDTVRFMATTRNQLSMYSVTMAYGREPIIRRHSGRSFAASNHGDAEVRRYRARARARSLHKPLLRSRSRRSSCKRAFRFSVSLQLCGRRQFASKSSRVRLVERRHLRNKCRGDRHRSRVRRECEGSSTWRRRCFFVHFSWCNSHHIRGKWRVEE